MGKDILSVTLCRWSAKQTIPLFWRKTRQRVWTRDLDATGSKKRMRVESWKKEPTEGNWQRVTRVAGRHQTAEVISRHERVQQQ